MVPDCYDRAMTKLTKKDTLQVASLAKLELTPNEVDKFTTQLTKVVDYISHLDEVNTKGVEPTAQTTNLTNVVREDKIDETRVLTQAEALSGTDKTKNGYFVVNAILRKDE